MFNLCGLWKSKNGKALTGRLGNLKILVLKNNFKKAEKQPDYVVCLAEYEKKDEEFNEADEGEFIEDDYPIPS